MAGPAKSQERARERPLSPHLQVWRWHVTMASSILHRASGVALYVGAAGLAIWLLALASGPEAFGVVAGLLATLPGQLAIYAMTVAIVYHMANGLRHLFWDFGAGYDPKAAESSGWLVIIVALAAPIGVFALANL